MQASTFVAYLQSLGLNVFPDPNFISDNVPADKLPCCFVFGTGGFESDRYTPVERPTFQVIVKGQKDASAAAEALAREVIKELDRSHNVTFGGFRILELSAMQGTPIPIGVDPSGRPGFSTNFRLRVLEVQTE